MINFRFHVVSIVAVFLALAIGVVFGSTVVDSEIVKGLRANIKDSELEASRTRDENERLKSQNDRFEGYMESSAPYAVANRLDGDALVVLAERGIDESVVADQTRLATIAGADVFVIWIEATSSFSGADATVAASLLQTSSTDPVALSALMADQLSARLTSDVGADLTSATDVVAALEREGFITIEDDLANLDDTSPVSRRSLVISSPTGAIADDRVARSVAAALSSAGVETVVGEVFATSDEGERTERGATVVDFTSGDLADRVATVDNIDEQQGRVSAVIAIADLARGEVAHFGFGIGATRSAPEWPES